jgi:hypothetical protein
VRYVQRFIEFFFRKKWLGLFILIAFFAGLGMSTVYRGVLGHKQRTDLAVYLKAAEMIREGRPNHLYGTETDRHWHYVYLPLLAIMFSPLTRIPFIIPVVIFYLISFLCFLGTLFLSEKFADDMKNAGWKITLATILCLSIFITTLSRGQMGMITLFVYLAQCFNEALLH